jgi:hypothetical protein
MMSDPIDITVLADTFVVIRDEEEYLSLFRGANAGDRDSKHIIACLHEISNKKRLDGHDCIECGRTVQPQDKVGAFLVVFHSEGLSRSMAMLFCTTCAEKYDGVKELVAAFKLVCPPDDIVCEPGHA